MANVLKSVSRYVRLYGWYLRANWLALMAYPATFVTMNLAGVVYAFGSVAAVWVLFSQVQTIGDWTFPQVLLIYGMSIFARSLFHLFWVDIMNVSGMVRSGDIDRYLVRPLDSLYQMIAGYLDNDDWGELVTSLILMWTSLGMLGGRTLPNMLWLLVAGISGSVIFASVHIVANAVAFFTVDNRGFTSLAWTVDEFSRYPTDIYDKVTRSVITWVIPVAFASFYPAQLIFGPESLRWTDWATPAVAAMTFAVAYRFWNFALDRYQGVGN